MISVQDEQKCVGTIERCITPGIRDNEVLRLGIETDDTEVEDLVGISDTDVGVFRSGMAGIGPRLPQITKGRNVHPGRVLHDPAVDDRRFIQEIGLRCRTVGVVLPLS